MSMLPVASNEYSQPDQPDSAVDSKKEKRTQVKPFCSFPGCNNGIVQGGRCVAHGASRPKCKFPGCDKNSKAAGLCSKHGPKRNICSVEGCTRFCIRGNKCRAHAEPSRKCVAKGCRKTAIHDGYCKVCHQNKEGTTINTPTSRPKSPPAPAVHQQTVYVPVPVPVHMLPSEDLRYYPAMFGNDNLLRAAGFASPHTNIRGFGQQPTTHHSDDNTPPAEYLNDILMKSIRKSSNELGLMEMPKQSRESDKPSSANNQGLEHSMNPQFTTNTFVNSTHPSDDNSDILEI